VTFLLARLETVGYILAMKLRQCRKLKGETVAESSAQVGVSVQCWRYWERLKKRPSPAKYPRILKWSDGVVTPNDFYNLPYHRYKTHIEA